MNGLKVTGKRSKLKTPIHPYLFALYPALSYLSHNISAIDILQIWRTFIASLMLVIGIWLIFGFLMRSKERAAIVSSLIILLLLSYGNIYGLLYGRKIVLVPLDRADVLAAIYAAVLILGTWSIWRIIRRVDKLNPYLNVVSIIAVVFPLISLIAFHLKIEPGVLLKSSAGEGEGPDKVQGRYPDIFYIILDGYGRDDFLQNYYGFDNSEFLNFLYENDFYIAESSHSNYNQTGLSLSSSMNYEYLDQILSERGSGSENRQPMSRLVQENQLAAFLKKKGYTFIAFSSGYEISEIRNADVYFDTLDSIINSFERGFLKNTAAIFWMEKLSIESHRRQMQNTIDQLGRVSDIKAGTPRFIFAHILLPHPPFAFGPNGEHLPFGSFLLDGDAFNGTSEEYINGYSGQLTYLNKLMEDTIAQILEKSESDPVIIIQGDHGPGAFLKWETLDQACFQERMGILNAYHLPGETSKQLYPSITPVNTFRLILNEYFEEDYTLLEDRVYFSKWSSPYEFYDVTTNADQCNLISRN